MHEVFITIISVLIHIIETRTSYLNKNFALGLTSKESLRGTSKWPNKKVVAVRYVYRTTFT